MQVGRISRFGLLEMSRQRLRPSLGEATKIVCPRCDGHGHIRSVESLSLSALRLVEEHAMKENTGQVLIQAPMSVANFLLNEKRASVVEIEMRHNVHVVVVADEKLRTPHLEITRIREVDMGEHTKPSYERLTEVEADPLRKMGQALGSTEEPVVSRIAHATPAPTPSEPDDQPAVASSPAPAPASARPGLIKRLLGGLFAGGEETPAASTQKPASARTSSRQARPDDERRGDNDSRRRSERRPGSGSRRTRAGESGERGSGGKSGSRGSGKSGGATRGNRDADGRANSGSQEKESRGKRGGASRNEKAGASPSPSPSSAPSPAASQDGSDSESRGSDRPENAANASPAGEKSSSQRRRRGRRGGRRRRRNNASNQDANAPASDKPSSTSAATGQEQATPGPAREPSPAAGGKDKVDTGRGDASPPAPRQADKPEAKPHTTPDTGSAPSGESASKPSRAPAPSTPHATPANASEPAASPSPARAPKPAAPMSAPAAQAPVANPPATGSNTARARCRVRTARSNASARGIAPACRREAARTRCGSGQARADPRGTRKQGPAYRATAVDRAPRGGTPAAPRARPGAGYRGAQAARAAACIVSASSRQGSRGRAAPHAVKRRPGPDPESRGAATGLPRAHAAARQVVCSPALGRPGTRASDGLETGRPTPATGIPASGRRPGLTGWAVITGDSCPAIRRGRRLRGHIAWRPTRARRH